MSAFQPILPSECLERRTPEPKRELFQSQSSDFAQQDTPRSGEVRRNSIPRLGLGLAFCKMDWRLGYSAPDARRKTSSSDRAVRITRMKTTALLHPRPSAKSAGKCLGCGFAVLESPRKSPPVLRLLHQRADHLAEKIVQHLVVPDPAHDHHEVVFPVDVHDVRAVAAKDDT
jgi:hypothetical protein